MDDNFRKDSFSIDALKKIEERERELMAYRERIAIQEKELDEYRSKLKNEQLSREKKLLKELEAREQFFADRERKLFDRQREIEEQLVRRQEEADQLRARLENEIIQRELQLREAMQALQVEKERYNEESRKKIESKSKDYVSDAIETLNNKESQFHFWSRFWSFSGAISLLAGILFFTYVTISSFASIPQVITWEFITFSIFKGLLVITLFGALTKYSFVLSNSYMREALKNGDRRHAINFGKFYLESYGAAADWSQVKEAFEHWNITGSNAFSEVNDKKMDVTSLEKAVSIIEKAGKSLQETVKG